MYADMPTLSRSDFQLKVDDYCLGSRKFAGNAQHFQRSRWLHHSSILWTANLSLMARYLHIPSKQPEYRAGRAHSDFVVPLNSLYGHPDEVFAEMLQVLQSSYDVQDLTVEEVSEICTLKHRKGTQVLELKPDTSVGS